MLLVGLPAAGQDARGLGGDPLSLVDVDRVAEREVAEATGVDCDQCLLPGQRGTGGSSGIKPPPRISGTRARECPNRRISLQWVIHLTQVEP